MTVTTRGSRRASGGPRFVSAQILLVVRDDVRAAVRAVLRNTRRKRPALSDVTLAMSVKPAVTSRTGTLLACEPSHSRAARPATGAGGRCRACIC